MSTKCQRGRVDRSLLPVYSAGKKICQPEIKFEEHYCEQMTEQEFDELCDLIAEMIVDKMKKDIEVKAKGVTTIKREQDGKAQSE